MPYLSITSSLSSNITSHDESILLQQSFYVSISGSDLRVEIYGIYKQMRALFLRSHQAKMPYNGYMIYSDTIAYRSYEVSYHSCSTYVYREKIMFVTGCKVSRNK